MLSGKPETMKEINKSLILETIRKNGPISRANLNKLLDLSFPAISSNVNALLEKGWIVETEKDSNKMGRKATLLEYNGDKGCVIGVDIGRSHISVIMADVAGNELKQVSAYSPWTAGDELMRNTHRLLEETLNAVPNSREKLMCIAVGIPGYRDEADMKNILAPFLEDWENIDVEKELREAFKTEIRIDNSVNYSAIGEKWRGNARNCKDMLYLGFGVGIGSALILNGNLYRGNNGVAGEIGYSLPDYRMARKEYSVEGVYERIVTGRAGVSNGINNMKELFEKADHGDLDACALLKSILHYTEVVLVNSIAMLNPEQVIFSGNIGKALLNRYREEISNFLRSHVPFVPKLEVSALGEKAGALGAVAAALRCVHSGFTISE